MSKPQLSTCDAPGCSNNKRNAPGTPYVSYPNDPMRCLQWTIACRRLDFLFKTPIELAKEHCICSDHFSPDAFNTAARKISKDACPIFFNFNTDTDNTKVLIPHNRLQEIKKLYEKASQLKLDEFGNQQLSALLLHLQNNPELHSQNTTMSSEPSLETQQSKVTTPSPTVENVSTPTQNVSLTAPSVQNDTNQTIVNTGCAFMVAVKNNQIATKRPSVRRKTFKSSPVKTTQQCFYRPKTSDERTKPCSVVVERLPSSIRPGAKIRVLSSTPSVNKTPNVITSQTSIVRLQNFSKPKTSLPPAQNVTTRVMQPGVIPIAQTIPIGPPAANGQPSQLPVLQKIPIRRQRNIETQSVGVQASDEGSYEELLKKMDKINSLTRLYRRRIKTSALKLKRAKVRALGKQEILKTLGIAKPMSREDFCTSLNERFSEGVCRQLFSMLIRTGNKSETEKEWTEEDMDVSANIYAENPGMYDFMRDLFSMPPADDRITIRPLLESEPDSQIPETLEQSEPETPVSSEFSTPLVPNVLNNSMADSDRAAEAVATIPFPITETTDPNSYDECEAAEVTEADIPSCADDQTEGNELLMQVPITELIHGVDGSDVIVCDDTQVIDIQDPEVLQQILQQSGFAGGDGGNYVVYMTE